MRWRTTAGTPTGWQRLEALGVYAVGQVPDAIRVHAAHQELLDQVLADTYAGIDAAQHEPVNGPTEVRAQSSRSSLARLALTMRLQAHQPRQRPYESVRVVGAMSVQDVEIARGASRRSAPDSATGGIRGAFASGQARAAAPRSHQRPPFAQAWPAVGDELDVVPALGAVRRASVRACRWRRCTPARGRPCTSEHAPGVEVQGRVCAWAWARQDESCSRFGRFRSGLRVCPAKLRAPPVPRYETPAAGRRK
jgi:hypothetical protein